MIVLLIVASLFWALHCFPYDERILQWNLNTNKTATEILDYSGEWENHQFMPSPDFWRHFCYTIILDKFADGDPSNNDANGTVFEHDPYEIGFRHGGDIVGIKKSLDYLQGMGVETIYIAGTPFLNEPWTSDGFSPIDLTILDLHGGTIDQWRDTIEEMHKRKMYLIMDLTVATLADRVGFNGYLNTSAPFSLNEYELVYKKPGVTYQDFDFNNEYDPECEYPNFWNEKGQPIKVLWKGCYDSDFDHYGDTEAFGNHPGWQRQLSKFQSVQDRLRDWRKPLQPKLNHLACLLISMLDVDGFRIDKATQMTADFLSQWSSHVRKCAAKYNKNNFLIPGEVTGGIKYGAIYYGRGRQDGQIPSTADQALALKPTDNEYYLRPETIMGMDSSAYHYSIYRLLRKFMRLDGNVELSEDVSMNFVDAWNEMLLVEDSYNPYAKKFDPRHFYGVTNHDVFRWPATFMGIERHILGIAITALMFPGNYLMFYGDEQSLYVLDNNANNFLYGRQSMTSSPAWYIHGCYTLGSDQFPAENFPNARVGCEDIKNSYDHKDPSHFLRNYHKELNSLRKRYLALHHGWLSLRFGNITQFEKYPNSDFATEVGLWSTARAAHSDQKLKQEFGKFSQTNSDTAVWILYTNESEQKTYQINCQDSSDEWAIRSPFKSGIVKNLIYPYEEHNLQSGLLKRGSKVERIGCLAKLTMEPFGLKVLVPKDEYIEFGPTVTKFEPGHDSRILYEKDMNLNIAFEFSKEMDCDSLLNNLSFKSNSVPETNFKVISHNCKSIEPVIGKFVGQIPSAWRFEAILSGAIEGIHEITIKDVRTQDKKYTYDSTDHFLIRLGAASNPLVWLSANSSSTLMIKKDGSYYINHTASGASQFRYSVDFERTWTNWQDYTGGLTMIENSLLDAFKGTQLQTWSGHHVSVDYWSDLASSSSHRISGDYESSTRKFPHLFLMGPFNEYGYDAGQPNKMSLHIAKNETYFKITFVSDVWPAMVQLNVWGMNANKRPDQTFVLGDYSNRRTIARAPPSLLSGNLLNMKKAPTYPHSAYEIRINPYTRSYSFVPVGHWIFSFLTFFLMLIVPPATAVLAVFLFRRSFYQIKFNQNGRDYKSKRFFSMMPFSPFGNTELETPKTEKIVWTGASGRNRRKCILIATLEYDIPDWNIKIKIGGLGVMAQLMGQNLKHQDLVWVVPCVGDVQYPEAQMGEPIEVKIIDQCYTINVLYHYYENIKYVLLDAPVFRRQTTPEPYPARMDDLGSAIFYSAWNQCVAEVIRRNPIDLYHINDYHGALAPCYLLPAVIPVALSLHNAEFQGLWPLRTPEERDEVCAVYNISSKICSNYVQFGNVFNLLHAGVSYLRIHQKGFGAVGVSNKYGKRSWARYPIFWGLPKIGKLPNPDPSDKKEENSNELDIQSEQNKSIYKAQAQEWAGLKIDPFADLLVFVGRWSLQKGVDLVADLVPILLAEYNVQFIIVGPVIDLYGKFAAEKLRHMVVKYPDRVYSRPQFTQLPPFIFSGADFALIPSRDEPFGLVAVEFGRKGALGIGARVGGLGQMPGWWYSVESPSASHLLAQFENACRQALNSSHATRAELRAKSSRQRFPVVEWQRRLDNLQDTCIKISETIARKRASSSRNSVYTNKRDSFSRSSIFLPFQKSGHSRNGSSNALPENKEQDVSRSILTDDLQIQNSSIQNWQSNIDSSENVEDLKSEGAKGLRRQLSLGSRKGPGHFKQTDVEETLDVIKECENEDSIYWTPESVRARLMQNGEARTPSIFSEDSGEEEFDPQRGTVFDFYDEDIALKNSPALRPQFNRFNPRPPLSSSESDDIDISSFSPLNSTILSDLSVENSRLIGLKDSSLVPAIEHRLGNMRNDSRLSLASVMTSSHQKEFALSKTQQKFTDSNDKYLKRYAQLLQNLSTKNTKDELAVEHFLEKSEKEFFNDLRRETLGLSKPNKLHLNNGQENMIRLTPSSSDSRSSFEGFDRSLDSSLPALMYRPQRVFGLKRFMQRRIGDWPIYSFLLAICQILAITSLQLTLLSGSSGANMFSLYITGTFFIIGSCTWWFVYRTLPNVYVLSLPCIAYAMSFFLIGLVSLKSIRHAHNGIALCATWIYALASASGSFYFALNFGDEGGSGIRSWVFRACVVQGFQQLWSAVLWYWGSVIEKNSRNDSIVRIEASPIVIYIVWPISVLLIGIFLTLWYGLPDYYRQIPARIPAFYKSLIRRKLVIWFAIGTVLQNYWLSSLYGRSWKYIWGVNTSLVHPAATVAIMLFFFIFVWVALLSIFGYYSKTHSWLLPVFGVGLGAPRWAQQMWGTSSIGLFLPWAGRAGPYIGRCLWFWLGVLDSLQGVGIGMILLQTLTRTHVATTLVSGQIIGTLFTMLGRATAPNAIGPANVFVNYTAWSPSDGVGPFASVPFYICLLCQIVICFGYIQFFRKEQLAKP